MALAAVAQQCLDGGGAIDQIADLGEFAQGKPAEALVSRPVTRTERIFDLVEAEIRLVRLGPTTVGTHWLRDPYAEPVLLDARRAAWAHGIAARLGLISGLPAEGLLMAAQEGKPTLIVIGARRSRLPARLAAPTRARVQRCSPVPILTVPSAISGRTGRASARVSSPTSEVRRC